jgi:hypothetical protein
MAQDPESGEREAQGDEIDPSHDLDMVTLFTATTIDSEMEAGVLSSLLESNGIPSLVIGSPVPALGYQVQVPRDKADEARRILEEAQAAGPEAASEAEAAGESGLKD